VGNKLKAKCKVLSFCLLLLAGFLHVLKKYSKLLQANVYLVEADAAHQKYKLDCNKGPTLPGTTGTFDRKALELSMPKAGKFNVCVLQLKPKA